MPDFNTQYQIDLNSIARGATARDVIGTDDDDGIRSGDGDDLVYGGGGNDSVFGQDGFDVLFGGNGSDSMTGGTGGDFVYGGNGVDTLFGDSGYGTTKGSDLAADRLDGGAGRDLLVQGDGNDVMTGGTGADTFLFRWSDPMVAQAAGTGRAFTTITDFDASQDKLNFDVAGVGFDAGSDVNFVDGGAGDGVPGGRAASFFSGDADGSNGEAVMVLTGTGYASGADAVIDAQGEAAGDLIVYFNTTVNVASLLVVDGPDAAHSIARFTGITSLEDLTARPQRQRLRLRLIGDRPGDPRPPATLSPRPAGPPGPVLEPAHVPDVGVAKLLQHRAGERRPSARRAVEHHRPARIERRVMGRARRVRLELEHPPRDGDRAPDLAGGRDLRRVAHVQEHHVAQRRRRLRRDRRHPGLGLRHHLRRCPCHTVLHSRRPSP